MDQSSDIVTKGTDGDCGALISACTDGVLCVWSRRSGHCRRRRKLPPWVGSPSILQRLPTNPRYVCIASCVGEASHTAYQADTNDIDALPEVLGDPELIRKHAKSVIVIVDSYTLSITETIFHGNSLIGPLKFMAFLEPAHYVRKIVLADSVGHLQLISPLQDSDLDAEPVSSQSSSNVKISNIGNVSQLEPVVSITTNGSILGVLHRTHCFFMLMPSGTVFGRISFENSTLCPGYGTSESYAVGCTFLHCGNVSTLAAGDTLGRAVAEFAVWNNRGSATVYGLSYLDDIFDSEVLCEIPSVNYPSDIKISVTFIELRASILRLESVCFDEEEPLFWKLHITLWSWSQPQNMRENIIKRCILTGEGDFLVDWIGISHKLDGGATKHAFCTRAAGLMTSMTFHGEILAPKASVDSLSIDDLKYVVPRPECMVSCSMVVSHNSGIPQAVVYGFQNGEIELIRFPMHLDNAYFADQDVRHDMKPHEAKQHFFGHRDAVLCLATHEIVTTAGRSSTHFLLSGSMDCTVHIWDLRTGDLMKVMHHHVGPVRQLILPPRRPYHPWNDCFLSVGQDFCVALVSLQTMRVERMFPGHPNYPVKVVWDGEGGYLACLSQDRSTESGMKDVLYIWDIKSGSRDRVLRGSAAHSLFDFFGKTKNMNSINDSILRNTSTSSVSFPLRDDEVIPSFQQRSEKRHSPSLVGKEVVELMGRQPVAPKGSTLRSDTTIASSDDMLPVRCSCPLSGVPMLSFDLTSLMFVDIDGGHELDTETQKIVMDGSGMLTDATHMTRKPCLRKDFAMCLLQLSLWFLHLWDADFELDKLMGSELKIKKPETFTIVPGLEGDRGSVTLAFPGFRSALELWKSSSEFCAMRSLALVSLAQRIVSLSPSFSTASSALSAFYNRTFAEKYPQLKPPSLQLLVSFWQHEEAHIRMAARSLFHCAASRAIPSPLFSQKAIGSESMGSCSEAREIVAQDEAQAADLDGVLPETQAFSENNDAEILEWIESYELQDWISCVGGTSQDAMASHIIVAAALAIWYPSLVRRSLAELVVNPLIKLVMSMNEKFSSTAAELLAEGMDSTWKTCIVSEIPRLIGDVFFQIECMGGASANTPAVQSVPPRIRETLASVLLPSLGLADIASFLTVIEGLIWSTSSDSPVHLVSLRILTRVIRGSPRILAEHLTKVVNFILQTMDPNNLVMRRTCLQSSMVAVSEIARVFPMAALNKASTQFAVGDAVSEINCAPINVYDLLSVTKIKILDASGPPGLPIFLAGTSKAVTTTISVLSFSPDGEGLVAFSEHGLIIRWWSFGAAWWEKLSRNLVPVQCTKLIFVPPWEGFSPSSSRASVMGKIAGNAGSTGAMGFEIWTIWTSVSNSIPHKMLCLLDKNCMEGEYN
ncbi:hypothetical protein Droror1_Dr00008207 [Drosera rotundifolia]